MTTPHLSDDIGRDEGCVLHAYPDPLSHGEPYTIGYGHTEPGVIKPGMVWTQAQADAALAHDIGHVVRSLDERLPWWRDLSDERQDVLCSMGFNLGVDGLLKFKNTLRAVHEGRWLDAAAGLLASQWAAQVGDRSKRLAKQMLTGERTHQA